MALNYADRETLRPQLIPRIKEALRKYFLYVQGDGNASAERKTWVTTKMIDLSQMSEQLSHYITSETAFIDTGTTITDGAIGARIESVLGPYFGMPA